MRFKWTLDVDDTGDNRASWRLAVGVALIVLGVTLLAVDVWLIKSIL